MRIVSIAKGGHRRLVLRAALRTCFPFQRDSRQRVKSRDPGGYEQSGENNFCPGGVPRAVHVRPVHVLGGVLAYSLRKALIACAISPGLALVKSHVRTYDVHAVWGVPLIL
jgi:hypothetical protein